MDVQFLRKIPFSYHWIINRLTQGEINTVLDVGCGEGGFMEAISLGRKWTVTGVDIHKPSLEIARRRGVYSELIASDITRLPKKILSKKYDLVFCSQVVEHLPKKKALQLIDTLEKIAKRKIIITTIVGFMEFCPLEEQVILNPHQKHLSGWNINEFTTRRYRVYGQGLSIVYRKGGLAHTLPRGFAPMLFLLSYLFSPLTYLFPNLATYQIACKNIA